MVRGANASVRCATGERVHADQLVRLPLLKVAAVLPRHRTDVEERVWKVLGQIADDPVGRLPFPVGLLLAPPILDDARRRERDFVPRKDFTHADRVTQCAEKLHLGLDSLKTAVPYNINDVF